MSTSGQRSIALAMFYGRAFLLEISLKNSKRNGRLSFIESDFVFASSV